MGTVGKMQVLLGADNSDLKKGLKESEGLISSTMSKITDMKAQLLSIGAMAMPIKAAQNWAAAVNDLEDKTNMAGESASRLLAVGEYVGLSTEEMSNAMAKMSKTSMTAAVAIATAAESGRTSTDVFSRFGIQILDNNGRLLSAEQILNNVTEKHRSMANGVEKTAMEMEIFGRSGAKLNDLLNLTSGQFNEVYLAAEKAGLVLSHKTTQAFEDAQFKINQAKMSMRGFAVTIGAEMLPQVEALSDGIKDVTEWFTNLSSREKKAIVITLETAAAISAVTIAGKGVMVIAGSWITAIGGIAAAYDALKISALGAYKTAALVAGGATAIGAAVGAATVGVYSYVNDLDSDEITSRYFDNKETRDQKAANPANFRKIDEESTKIKETDEQRLMRELQEEMDKLKGTVDFSALGGGGGAKAAKSRAHDMTAEINRINEKIVDMKKDMDDLTKDFSDFHIQVQIDSLVGSEKVYAELEQEKNARLADIDEWQNKFKDAREKAEAVVLSAVKTGDQAAIASARERVEAVKDLELKAMQDIAEQRRLTNEKYKKDRESVANQMVAYQADLEEAMNQGNVKAYMAAMEKLKTADADARGTSFAAFEADLKAKQTLMQQYHDWRMEAEQSYQTLTLEIGENMKNGFAASISDAIVYTKNLGEALRDVAKQVLAMSIQFSVKKAISGIFTGGLGNASSGGAGKGSFGFSNGDFFGFAAGGIVTAPTFALIGEGKDKEAVLPLNRKVLSQISNGIFDSGRNSPDIGRDAPINNYFQVKDADSFKKSRSQISAELYGAVQRGRR